MTKLFDDKDIQMCGWEFKREHVMTDSNTSTPTMKELNKRLEALDLCREIIDICKTCDRCSPLLEQAVTSFKRKH